MSIHTRLAVALLAVFFSYHTVVRAQITITSVTPTTACAGSSITVFFTNNDAERSSLSLYLYPTQSADSLAISQSTNVSGDGSLSGYIPANQVSGSYRVSVKKVAFNGAISIAKSDSFSIHAIPPAPTVTSSLVYCQGVHASSLPASGSSLNWYTSPVGGIASASVTPTTVQAGTYNYYVSQMINSCESPRSVITVVVIPTPSSPLVNSVTYCQGSPSIPLTVVAIRGSGLNWYTTPTGGSATSSIIPFTSITGITKFYVSQSVNGCESPRAALTVTVIPNPSVTITGDELTLTPNRTSILLTAMTSASLFVWSRGDSTSSITVNAPGDYSVTVKDDNGCSNTSSVTIDQSPVEVLYSVKAGEWNDPSVWSTNQIPTNTYAVRLHHIITIPTGYQAQTQALRYRPGGKVQLNTGSNIKTGP